MTLSKTCKRALFGTDAIRSDPVASFCLGAEYYEELYSLYKNDITTRKVLEALVLYIATNNYLYDVNPEEIMCEIIACENDGSIDATIIPDIHIIENIYVALHHTVGNTLPTSKYDNIFVPVDWVNYKLLVFCLRTPDYSQIDLLKDISDG